MTEQLTQEPERNPEQLWVAHAQVYRVKDEQVEFLLIRRVPEDGGFWQPVTGGIESDEKIRDAVLREVHEETGLADFLYVSDVLHRTHWLHERSGRKATDLVHAIEVAATVEVALSDEHDDYLWLPFERAIEQLHFDGNQESMRIVYTHILERLTQQEAAA
ncbi:MAG: NUDIX hydrolase [Candidatus Saccharimonadales bacterium]